MHMDFADRDTCPSGRLNLFCYGQVLTYLDKCKLIQKFSMFLVVLIASLYRRSRGSFNAYMAAWTLQLMNLSQWEIEFILLWPSLNLKTPTYQNGRLL